MAITTGSSVQSSLQPRDGDGPVQIFPRGRRFWQLAIGRVVVMLACVVHWPPSEPIQRVQAATSAPVTNETLPRAAAETRDALLAAVQSGDLGDLKSAIELNEMRPDLADTPVDDPVAYWRSISADGTGKDVLIALGKALALPPAEVPLGADIENNRIYVWPYLAERAAGPLTATEEADLATLVTPQEVTAIRSAKHWIGWRVTIGADGVWHGFRREK